MNTRYAWLIYCTPDGMRVVRFERVALQQTLDDCGLLSFSPFRSGETIDSDPNYWGERYLVIDGDIVTPEAVQVVTERRMP